MEPDPEDPSELRTPEAAEGEAPDPGQIGAGSDLPDAVGRVGDESEEAVDGDVPGDDESAAGKDPLRFSNWMKRSATGAVMTGISIGLREALESNRNEPAIMIEASGEPDDPDHPIRLHFDPDNPAGSVAVIRSRGPTGPDGTTGGAG